MYVWQPLDSRGNPGVGEGGHAKRTRGRTQVPLEVDPAHWDCICLSNSYFFRAFPQRATAINRILFCFMPSEDCRSRRCDLQLFILSLSPSLKTVKLFSHSCPKTCNNRSYNISCTAHCDVLRVTTTVIFFFLKSETSVFDEDLSDYIMSPL